MDQGASEQDAARPAAEGAKRQCPASGGWDDPEEFGVAPAPLIEQQLRR